MKGFYDNKKTLYFMQRMLGYMCLLLTPTCIGFGFLGYENNAHDFWYSISATYYASSKICMIGLLFTTFVFFICYRGYDLIDRIITDVSGISALGIIVFPCYTSVSHSNEGLLDISIKYSNIFHCIFASLLFTSFAIMIGFRFTKSAGTMSDSKKNRNKLYIICAIVIAIFMVSQVVTSILEIHYMTVVNEFFMLTAFGIAWLTKGQRFKQLNDKEK